MRRFALLPLLAPLSCSPAPTPPRSPPPLTASAPPPASAPAPAPHGIPVLISAPPPLGADRIAFTLFKFLSPIGGERDTYVPLPGGGTQAKAVFSFRDRMATVPLAATFDFAADGSLERYAAWGKTSRFSAIDDRIAVKDGAVEVTREGGKPARLPMPTTATAIASSYAPMLALDLLLRAWNQHGRPATMPLLPEGELAIEARGKETYARGAEKVTLEHLSIRGLVWGREDAWLDDKGALAAVVTRDAEFDHWEATREGFDPVLPELAKATGGDGVAWLAEQAKAARRETGARFALVGGTVIDGLGGPPIKDAVVVVDGERIAAAGPKTKVAVPAGATVVDVSGKFIIPGLWDMHAHVEQVEQGAVYLAAGVTTVRDMGNILDFIVGVRDAIDAGRGLGPRILVNGIVDGEGPAALGIARIKSREDTAPTVDRLKKAGCAEVKIYSSIAPSLVKPIAAYAHAHGMRVVGHVPIGMTSVEAIDAGFDSISHFQYLIDDAVNAGGKATRDEYLRRAAALDLASPIIKKEIAALIDHHVVLDDTLALEEELLHTDEEEAKREPGTATLPRELRVLLGGVPPERAAASDAAFERYLVLLGELHKRGVRIVAGTDIAVPGHSLHREIELYVKAGFTPMEALQAATIVPARVMHLEKESGSVEAGKRADLVVLDADPLADVSNVRRTSLVVARGRAYEPRPLWTLAGFTPIDPGRAR